MALLKPREKKAVPAVNVAEENMRTVQLPMPKNYTEAELDDMTNEKGNDPLAICDFTGEPIYLQQNVNEIHSTRPELNGKVISSAALVKLLEGTVNAITLAKVAKKPAKK